LGLYRISIDPSGADTSVIPLRAASWHLNALKFLEPPQGGSLISLSNISVAGHQVELDVTIQHPFPGMDHYVGFDVKGIVVGQGDITDSVDGSRIWGGGPNGLRVMNADGWTRWWNPTEFPYNGTVFSYKDSQYATQSSTGLLNSTLCGYRVFASVLEKDDPITKLLSVPIDHPNGRATFHASESATRHYRIVFPGDVGSGPNYVFNYAVDACHGFPDGYVPGEPIEVPDDFPPDANQLEPFILDVNTQINTLYLLPQGCMGGELEFTIRLSDWQALMSGTAVSQQVESVEITSPTLFVGERYPALISDSTPANPWATYRIHLNGLTPDSALDQQILVSVKSTEGDYQTDVSSYIGNAGLESYYVLRVPISQTGPVAGGGFVINPYAVWAKTGGDKHNTNRSIGHGPDAPSAVWEVSGLLNTCRPLVDAEGRIYVSRRFGKGGVGIVVLDSDGYTVAQMDIPDFLPSGDPVLVGCSMIWSDESGRVVRIYPDGTWEDLYTPGGTGIEVYGFLNMDDKGRAILHGPSGMYAFDEDGKELWSIPKTKSAIEMYVGPSSLTGSGVIVVGELFLENSSIWSFSYSGIDSKNGAVKWEYSSPIPFALGFGATSDPDNGQIYFALSNNLVAITNDGQGRWTRETNLDLSPTIALGLNGDVYAAEIGNGATGEDEYELLAFNKHGDFRWKYGCPDMITAGPIVDSNGNLFIATKDADVYCLWPDGSQKWFRDFPGQTSSLTFGPGGTLLMGLVQAQFTTSVVCLRDSE
jgi:hypothetical protein